MFSTYERFLTAYIRYDKKLIHYIMPEKLGLKLQPDFKTNCMQGAVQLFQIAMPMRKVSGITVIPELRATKLTLPICCVP
jgi:hypothetical protein